MPKLIKFFLDWNNTQKTFVQVDMAKLYEKERII